MKFIDMFCGMGTARMAFEQAGHECAYSIELDKHKRKIYGVVFGNEPGGSDIKTVRADQLPRADCWIAGFPCQDISIAGKQLGFEGNKSSLYFEVVRLLCEAEKKDRPSYLLLENVKNFLSVNAGRDFLSALCALDAVGYDAEWNLLNSKHFGVPQNRERVFIVGHLRGRNTKKIFPLVKNMDCKNTAVCVTARGYGSQRNGTYVATDTVKQIANIMPTKTRDNPNLENKRIRMLTPKECMRLQGVSDKVTDKLIKAGISDTQLYRAAGDAWTVNVGYEIAKRM